jgi:hypothetical protein
LINSGKLDKQLKFKGASSSSLSECQGDCDGDADCEGDLKCFQRDDAFSIPGCEGVRDATSRSDYDYCYNMEDVWTQYWKKITPQETCSIIVGIRTTFFDETSLQKGQVSGNNPTTITFAKHEKISGPVELRQSFHTSARGLGYIKFETTEGQLFEVGDPRGSVAYGGNGGLYLLAGFHGTTNSGGDLVSLGVVTTKPFGSGKLVALTYNDPGQVANTALVSETVVGEMSGAVEIDVVTVCNPTAELRDIEVDKPYTYASGKSYTFSMNADFPFPAPSRVRAFLPIAVTDVDTGLNRWDLSFEEEFDGNLNTVDRTNVNEDLHSLSAAPFGTSIETFTQWNESVTLPFTATYEYTTVDLVENFFVVTGTYEGVYVGPVFSTHEHANAVLDECDRTTTPSPTATPTATPTPLPTTTPTPLPTAAPTTYCPPGLERGLPFEELDGKICRLPFCNEEQLESAEATCGSSFMNAIGRLEEICTKTVLGNRICTNEGLDACKTGGSDQNVCLRGPATTASPTAFPTPVMCPDNFSGCDVKVAAGYVGYACIKENSSTCITNSDSLPMQEFMSQCPYITCYVGVTSSPTTSPTPAPSERPESRTPSPTKAVEVVVRGDILMAGVTVADWTSKPELETQTVRSIANAAGALLSQVTILSWADQVVLQRRHRLLQETRLAVDYEVPPPPPAAHTPSFH